MSDTADDLPPELADLVAVDADRVATLYNGLQGMEDAAFGEAFADSLARLQRVVATESTELAAVLALSLDGGLVTDATLLSVHVLDGDRVLHTAGDDVTPDAALYVPVRPDDFPPGSGGMVDDLTLPEYREVVASMLFLHYQLAENDPDQFETRYRAPLARGLAAYADR